MRSGVRVMIMSHLPALEDQAASRSKRDNLPLSISHVGSGSWNFAWLIKRRFSEVALTVRESPESAGRSLTTSRRSLCPVPGKCRPERCASRNGVPSTLLLNATKRNQPGAMAAKDMLGRTSWSRFFLHLSMDCAAGAVCRARSVALGFDGGDCREALVSGWDGRLAREGVLRVKMVQSLRSGGATAGRSAGFQAKQR